MYNIRCDPDIGVDTAAVRRTPCACSFCIEQLELPWDKNKEYVNQKRYNVNNKYLQWNIFDVLNDWNIILLVTQTKDNNSEKDDGVFETILREVNTRMSERTNDESTNGFYTIQWTSNVYTLQEYKEIEAYKPTKTGYEGDIVCDTVFLNPVPTEKN